MNYIRKCELVELQGLIKKGVPVYKTTNTIFVVFHGTVVGYMGSLYDDLNEDEKKCVIKTPCVYVSGRRQYF